MGPPQSRYCQHKLSKCLKIYTNACFHAKKTLPKQIFKVPFKYKPPVHFSKAKLSYYPIATPNHLNLLIFPPSYPNFPKNTQKISKNMTT